MKKKKRGPRKQKENKPGKPRKRKKLVSSPGTPCLNAWVLLARLMGSGMGDGVWGQVTRVLDWLMGSGYDGWGLGTGDRLSGRLMVAGDS